MNWDWLSKISISAVIQIFILYLVIYSILKSAKGSRFGQALMGVAVLASMMFAFTYVFKFDVLSQIIRAVLIYLAISTVVIFQPEIRRVLSQVGAFNYFERPNYTREGIATPEFIVSTILALSKRKIGALFAFERGISLRGYEDSGIMLNAVFSRELLESILTPPLPLHDGGITVRNGLIAAAHCVFPISNNPELIASGMRHRAAVGLSEETDALVVVISEESGAISIAHNGKLVRYHDSAQAEPSLNRWISKAMSRKRNSLRFSNRLTRLFAKGGDKR